MLDKAINSWLDGYRKIFCYEGRSTRSEFGYFILFQFIALFTFTIIGIKILPLLLVVICLAIFLIVNFFAILSYNVRRLHDANASGWWCLGYFFCGEIIIVVSLILTPISGVNKYGPDPRTLPK